MRRSSIRTSSSNPLLPRVLSFKRVTRNSPSRSIRISYSMQSRQRPSPTTAAAWVFSEKCCNAVQVFRACLAVDADAPVAVRGGQFSRAPKLEHAVEAREASRHVEFDQPVLGDVLDWEQRRPRWGTPIGRARPNRLNGEGNAKDVSHRTLRSIRDRSVFDNGREFTSQSDRASCFRPVQLWPG